LAEGYQPLVLADETGAARVAGFSLSSSDIFCHAGAKAGRSERNP
jgi:hypothetical protein